MNWIKEFRRKYFIHFDTISSLIAGIIVFCILSSFNFFIEIKDEVITSMLRASTGLLGFLIAVMAIIFTFKDAKKLKVFQKTTHYGQVLDIYISAITWFSLLSIGLLLVVIIDLPFQSFANRELLVSLFISFSIIKIWRCIWITKEIFNLSNS